MPSLHAIFFALHNFCCWPNCTHQKDDEGRRKGRWGGTEGARETGRLAEDDQGKYNCCDCDCLFAVMARLLLTNTMANAISSVAASAQSEKKLT